MITTELIVEPDDHCWAAWTERSDGIAANGVGDTPVEAVRNLIDMDHRAYGNSLPQLEAVPGPEDYER